MYGIKQRIRKDVTNAIISIYSGNNNTIIAITDFNGNVIAWSSAGERGFKGTKKSTPFAAQITSESCIKKAKLFNIKNLEVEISGLGSGRESALRALQTTGLTILSIRDVNVISHNGCRSPKKRRV